MTQILGTTAVRSVYYYTASPVQCCDRCSQGIKHVARVTYKDGLVQQYGLDCIDRILQATPTLGTLYRKNAKLLVKYRNYLEILTGPVEAMPRGREYFGSGLYFIADAGGKDIFTESSWLFHPVYDVERNGDHERSLDRRGEGGAVWVKRCQDDIDRKVAYLNKEIPRIEGFLARVLSKAGAEAVKLAEAAQAAPVETGDQGRLF
jgi:hypothetical protein